ncbi:unnamed protein product [Effrenium voratum]|uniref:J domain-containing protein n=1 Tax=Effrenium voratum TaxID=2562239 RepID=A0AA36JAP7_9DINO|nr:unnamed protein product [Effrenium voratum]
MATRARRKEASVGRRTESQPVFESQRLPQLGRSASQPPRQAGDEIFSIMVMRQLQMRKDLAGQARQASKNLPRLDCPSQNHQEQAAILIASMAEAVSNGARFGKHRKEAHVPTDPDHWPALVQQAALAASSAAAAEASGISLDTRGYSKTSMGSMRSVEEHLSPFAIALNRRRAREAKAREEHAEREAPTKVKEEATRPETPAYPSPFKEQPPPPPMPPDWSERLWEDKKRELAEERSRRAPKPQPQAERQPDFVQPEPPPAPPREDSLPAWRPWRCPIFPWTKNPEERPPAPGPAHGFCAPGAPPRAPAAPSAPGAGLSGARAMPRAAGAAGPGKGPGPPPDAKSPVGHSWNWGSGIFAGNKVKPLFQVPQAADLEAKRTRELIAQLEEEMQKTRVLPLEERKRVFKDLQRRFHPDKNPLEEQSATLAFQHLMDSRHSYLRP